MAKQRVKVVDKLPAKPKGEAAAKAPEPEVPKYAGPTGKKFKADLLKQIVEVEKASLTSPCPWDEWTDRDGEGEDGAYIECLFDRKAGSDEYFGGRVFVPENGRVAIQVVRWQGTKFCGVVFGCWLEVSVGWLYGSDVCSILKAAYYWLGRQSLVR